MEYLKKFPALVLGCLLVPGIIAAAVLCVIFRSILDLIYKLKYDGRYSLASPTDSTYSVEKHANTITINNFSFLKGSADIGNICDIYKNRMFSYTNEKGQQPFKKFTWRLIRKFGFFTWEDTGNQFDIREHVKLCPGADSLHQIYTEQEVLEAVGKIADNLFNPDRPQWELLLVPNVKLGESGDAHHHALILRVHHAYMDGISLFQSLRLGMLDNPDVKFTIDPINPPIPEPTVLQLIGHYILVMLLGSHTLVEAYLRSRVHPDNIFQTKTENTGPKYFARSTMPMTMGSVKTIRKAFKCSTTAVFNCAISGALRKAAERKGLPVPEEVDFGFTVALLPYPDECPENRFTIAGRRAPVGISDPRDRLAKLDKAVRSFAAHDITAMYWGSKVLGYFPAIVIQMVLDDMHSGYVVTNVPGFSETIHIDGSPIEEMYGCPPIKNGIGFAIGVSSYKENIRACWAMEHSPIISSREDAKELVADYEREFCSLESIANKCLNVNNN